MALGGGTAGDNVNSGSLSLGHRQNDTGHAIMRGCESQKERVMW